MASFSPLQVSEVIDAGQNFIIPKNSYAGQVIMSLINMTGFVINKTQSLQPIAPPQPIVPIVPTASHQKQHRTLKHCNHGPNCHGAGDKSCPFFHPHMVRCKGGSKCETAQCPYWHECETPNGGYVRIRKESPIASETGSV